MGLNDLPNEVIVKIFRYLSIEDLGNWTKVSKRFRNVCLDKGLPYGKMKNVFRKDMSQKDLENSLAKKIKMIRKLKTEQLANKLGFDRLAFLKQMNLVPKRLAYHPPLRRKNKQAQSTNRNM